MFEGVNAIQGILCLVYHGSIQIIANIPGSESPDCVRIQNVECLNGCVNGISLENQVTEKLHMIIWSEHNNNDEICTLDSGDDVGFSFVSGIRHGLHFVRDRLATVHLKFKNVLIKVKTEYGVSKKDRRIEESMCSSEN